MKRTIEIDDTLQERAQMAINEVQTAFLEYLSTNRPDSLPDLANDLDYDGRIHEIVDGCVPVYTYEIRCTWFLHAAELTQAYDDAGIGDNPSENEGMTAIYLYIEQRVHEWYRDEAQAVFDAWKAGQEAA